MSDKNFLMREMIRAVLLASDKIMEIYNNTFEVSYKDDLSPLTTADIASNMLITEHLRSTFPQISILSEEECDSSDRLTNKNGVFILDPLDGTKEFLNRNSEFCVSLAYSLNNRVVCGVIAVPEKRVIYYAYKNMGAYKADFCDFSDNFNIGIGTKIHVSERHEKIILTVSRSHMDDETHKLIERNKDRILQIITVGSCLKGCYIAEGLADVHYRWGEFTKEWDTSAMQVICEESGAIFTDVLGNELTSNRNDPINRAGFRILNNKKSALDTENFD